MPPETSFPWSEVFGTLGSSAVSFWLLWYIVTKHLPKIEERHRDERQELVRAIDKKDEKHDRIVQAFNETMKRSIEVQSSTNGRLDGFEKSIQQIPQIIREQLS